MRIAAIHVRQVAVPRIYDTYCADPKNLKNTIDHGRSTYQIPERMRRSRTGLWRTSCEMQDIIWRSGTSDGSAMIRL